jgi:Uncharacterized protein conserved in bacteria (DUF2252)
MNINKATERYEQWLGQQLRILAPDLELKHQAMRSAPFPFLRATYYRWAQTWPEASGDAARAPKVLAVGDLHVENFGTWRDSEGRLIWGINDFDEACRLPYTNDLVRLGTSALFAELQCDEKAALAAILKGYSDGVAAGGHPFALAEHHPVLREMAVHRLHEPEKFWEKLHALPEIKEEAPASAVKAIGKMLPEQKIPCRLVHRVAGLGSLGRERYVALAEWRGGSIAREAKALAPSAQFWADGDGDAPIFYQEIIDTAVRTPDPFVRLQKRWIVRRLAPDCSRIELSALPKERDSVRLLHAMGFETANVHLGSIRARALAADLKKRPKNWLYRAAQSMRKAVAADFEEYRA